MDLKEVNQRGEKAKPIGLMEASHLIANKKIKLNSV
jgi:hypothetical protein